MLFLKHTLIVCQLQEATKEDRVLNEVVKFLSTGIWPTAHDVNNELRPYYMKRGELSLHDNVMWGLRVVLPLKFRARVLSDLYNGHPGIVRMKGLSRIHVWYPEIDQDIENTVHSCHECSKHKNKPAKAFIHPWNWPTGPFDRVICYSLIVTVNGLSLNTWAPRRLIIL